MIESHLLILSIDSIQITNSSLIPDILLQNVLDWPYGAIYMKFVVELRYAYFISDKANDTDGMRDLFAERVRDGVEMTEKFISILEAIVEDRGLKGFNLPSRDSW